MKHPLIALTLLAAAPLSAGYHDQPDQYESEENCYSCDPCCTPKPKKCIDCECYTPAYYDLQCDWGLSLSVDFLYWYARETNLNYATRTSTTSNTGTIFNDGLEFINLGTDWDPGVRVGIGYSSSCDGWDSSLNWTYMRNKRTDSSSASQSDLDAFFEFPAQGTVFTGTVTLLENPWNFVPAILGNEQTDTTIFSIPGWTKISASWTLTFNQFDWQLGRKYWLSKCFSLRPYAGLRGGWIEAKLEVTGTTNFNDDANPFFVSSTSKTKSNNCSWGVGFLGGIQPNWHFCSNFILYSDLGVALLWGEFKSKTDEKVSSSGTATTTVFEVGISPFSFKNNFYQMQPVIDLGIGLRWEETWCCDRYRTALDLGWEHHVWFDYNHRSLQTDGEKPFAANGPPKGATAQQTLIERTGNLMMGGLVVRARFDF